MRIFVAWLTGLLASLSVALYADANSVKAGGMYIKKSAGYVVVDNEQFKTGREFFKPTW